MWPFNKKKRNTEEAKERALPNLLEIARTTISLQDRRRPAWQHIGERGARKAAAAAQRAIEKNGRSKDVIIDALEASISAQYAARSWARVTRPDWIDFFLADAA